MKKNNIVKSLEQLTNLEIITVIGGHVSCEEKTVIKISTNKENQRFVSSAPFSIFINENQLCTNEGALILFKEYWFNRNFSFLFLKTISDKTVLLVLKSKTNQRHTVHNSVGMYLCNYNFELFSVDRGVLFDDIFQLRDDGIRNSFLRFHFNGRDYLHLVISNNGEKRFFRFDRIAWPNGNCKEYFDIHEVFTLDNIKVNEIFGFFPLNLDKKNNYRGIKPSLEIQVNYLVLFCSDLKYRIGAFYPFGGFRVSEELLKEENNILSFKNFLPTNNNNFFCLVTEDNKRVAAYFNLFPRDFLKKIEKNISDPELLIQEKIKSYEFYFSCKHQYPAPT
jgi:hypothetical protein